MDWVFWIGVVAASSTALGAAAGVVSWFLNMAESERKDRALQTFQAEALVSIAAAEARAAEANERTEQARAENVAMLRILLPRRISSNFPGTENPPEYDSLNEFAGTRALILVAPELEAQKFAGSIFSVLFNAGWKPEIRTEAKVFDGTAVFSGAFPEPGSEPDRTWLAGEALVKVLNAALDALDIGAGLPISNHPGDIRPPTTTTYARPEGAVLIEVGERDFWSQIWMLKHKIKAHKADQTP